MAADGSGGDGGSGDSKGGDGGSDLGHVITVVVVLVMVVVTGRRWWIPQWPSQPLLFKDCSV